MSKKETKKVIPEIRNYRSNDPNLRSFSSGDVDFIRRRVILPQSSTIASEGEFPPLTPERERRTTTRSTTRAQSTAWIQSPHKLSYHASALEAHSSPATSGNISQLDPLSRETSTVHSRPSTPSSRVEPTTDITEINSSPIPFSTEYQDSAEEETEGNSSAQSGFNPGGSDNDLDYSFTTQGYNEDNSPSTDPPPPPPDPPPPPPIPPIISPSLLSATTTSKMASFDAELEHLFLKIMKYELSTPLALAVHEYGVKEFEHFRSLGNDLNELPKLTIPSGAGVDKTISTIDAKALTKAVIYTLFMEDSNHADYEDPRKWDVKEYQKWSRQGPARYIAKMNSAISTAFPSTTGSTSAPFVPLTQQQKDDDAALISWNRKTRDPSKYPIIKDDAGYQDFKLKFKRQLIEDKLSRVMDPAFTITGCRSGSDEDLADLQVNFFAQVLSAVLQNAEGKGLVTVHPDNPLYIWSQHEAHQLSSDSAQIGSTILMSKLINRIQANRFLGPAHLFFN
jgi:hypothetical protein